MEKSLQETYAPHNACFGCGPANPKGLRIQSFVHADQVEATFTPAVHHEAFPGVLNGGIIGTILDCHCNWTAAWHLMETSEAKSPPCTVTASYSIKMLKPTPSKKTLKLIAKVDSSEEDRAHISATLSADGEVTATCKGLFVAVKPGHPAYHRW